MIPREPLELFELARGGSRTALARLLTYVESGGATQLDTVALAYEARSPTWSASPDHRAEASRP